MEGTNGPVLLCTVCREEMKAEGGKEFGGAPVCDPCFDRLDLGSMDIGGKDDRLLALTEGQGQDIMGEFTALARSMPKEYGWNILAIVGNITESVEDAQASSLLESSTMLCGLSVLRLGEGEGEVDPGLLSLFLVLGQVMDLSIMRRIVLSSGLRTSNRLDELFLIGDHNRTLFELIRNVDHGEDEQKEMILAICMEKLV
ncbi:MAG: hypothetical protein ACMUHY_05590 [Thermoplasmatota archaeon]